MDEAAVSRFQIEAQMFMKIASTPFNQVFNIEACVLFVWSYS
jgi:hypothetical protein